MSTRLIKVDELARVEGEGALRVSIEDDELVDVRLRIFEPPRFFEAMLRGRDFREAPDITARICGICPVAYLMSAAHAMESLCGAVVPRGIRELRRLLYCGEWIESHVLHMFMLHAPDFLGYDDAITMARDHPDVVRKALRVKKIGNDIMRVLGGREIHPINVKVGGFYRLPERGALEGLIDDLRWGLEASEELLDVATSLPFEELERDYEFVCLRHPDEYPLNEGRLVSDRGLDVEISRYDEVLHEHQVEWSTALHTRVQGRGPCHLGPLARYNLNRDLLTPRALAAADRCGLGEECRNPFKSILARGVEVVFSFEEALRIIDSYEPPEVPSVDVIPRAGTGYGCTEAPRGICYHRYTIDSRGTITDAKIVSPTAVNQAVIEQDLWHFVSPRLDRPDDEIREVCERAIRNYDPCISCSTHFLKLEVQRS